MEKESTNTVTIELIKEQIRRNGIKNKEVCDGICSSGQLANILKGKKMPEKLVLDSIHQRIGLQTMGYESIVSREEYEIIKVLDDIVDKIDENNIDSTRKLMSEYIALIQHRNVVYHQLGKLLEGLIMEEGALDTYVDALMMTIPKYTGAKSLLKCRMSKLELTLYVLIIIEKCKKDDELDDIKLQLQLFERNCEITCIDEMAYVLCFYAGTLGEYLNKHGESQDANRITSKALKILQKVRRTYNVRQLLKVWSESADDMLEKKRAYWMYEAISEMYAEVGVDKESVAWCIPYVPNEVYPIDEVIRTRRKAMGINQVDLADGICSGRTISNIECGKCEPKPGKRMQLLRRLGINYCEYGVIDSLDVELHKLVYEWEDATNVYDIEKCARIGKILNQKLPESPINKQLLTFKEFIYNAVKNRKKGHYEIVELILALEITCKVWNKDIKWIYSGMEVNILYNIAEFMYRQDRSEEGEKIFKQLINFFDDRTLNMRHFLKGYALVETVYASWCGNVGNHESALIIGKRNARNELLYGGSQQTAYRMYGIGWDMEKGNLHNDMDAESTRYIKYAYAVGLLTKKYVAEHIENKGYDFFGNLE